MIFRKPYGFLIKHFKFIHLILTGLYIYLAIKVRGMLDYYNNFEDGIVGKLDALKFISNDYLVAVVLSIIICVVVYVLLRYKKKPRTLYLGLIGFVVAITIVINLAYGGLEEISASVIERNTLRLYRDLLKILLVFQYISIGIVFVRGLGFDIKKFNFVKDMHELNLDVTDEEEVELTLGNTNSLQRKFYRRLREFKYYYFENKLFIHVILVTVVFLGVSTFFVQKEVINKAYQEGESFSSNEFQFLVVDTFVTTKDDNNKIIGRENDSFVIIRMKIASNNGKKKLNKGNLVLEVNNNSYTSDGYYGSRFSDLGVAYQNQKIDKVYTYLFIFKVDKVDVEKSMRLVYADDKVVNLKPVMLDEVSKKETYKIGDSVNLSSSILGSGSFKINSFELEESFPYSYQYEVGGQIFNSQYFISSSKGAVLNLKINSSFVGDLNNYSFLDKYSVLKYKIGDTEYVMNSFDNKSPGNYKDGLYLAVDKRILEAQEIWFEISIRNKFYIYTIK